MNMIVNGLAAFIALVVFATFVAQVLASHRRSALWAAPNSRSAAAPQPFGAADIVDLDARRFGSRSIAA